MTAQQDDYYRVAVEARIQVHGELVKHISLGKEEWVKLHFTDVPSNADFGGVEIELIDVAPNLTGHVDDFGFLPEKFKNYNSQSDHKGSQFMVRGMRYLVQEVSINHRGGIKIDLSRSDASVDDGFFVEQSEADCA